jgi:DNA-binding IclR family transcriptional regulator
VWKRCLEACPGSFDVSPDELRARWASAAHLHTPQVDMGSVAEVAVPVVDASGALVAALAATVPGSAEAARVEEMAAHLARAATAAGRTLGHG